uniref:Uncharacterized protein n=1 Tax=viral metagenome TaxID=1070528 RepID=A0A6M3L0L0_9ZZZZ
MFTPEFILQVVAYGGAVIGIVQLIKSWLKLEDLPDWVKVITSVFASLVVCLPSAGSYSAFVWLVMVGCVILEANGLFKAFHKT